MPRLVGSYEYWQALQTLGQLASQSTAEEIAVYDELISERPEFQFHVGLARAYWGPQVGFDAAALRVGQSPNQALALQAEAGGTLRSGIGWLMALARIELSASLSAYTKTENPFAFFPVTPYDRQQYEILLFDDALNHLLALSQDPGLPKVAQPNRPADASSMDYLRRAKLVQDMVQAARKTSLNNEYTEQSWKQGYNKIDKEISKLRLSVHSSLQGFSSVRTLKSDYETIWACGVLLQAERNGDIRSRERVEYDSGGAPTGR